MGGGIVLIVAYHVAICGYGALVLIDTVIACRHLCSTLSAQLAVFWLCALVCRLVFACRVIVLSERHIFVALAHVALRTASRNHECDAYYYNKVYLLSHININAVSPVLFCFSQTSFSPFSLSVQLIILIFVA